MQVYIENDTYQITMDDGSHASVPNNPDNIARFKPLQDWLDAGNVAGPRPKTIAEVSGSITTEADKRVDAVMGDWRSQMRAQTAGNVINNKRNRSETLSAAELAKETLLRDQATYASAVRTAEEAAIASLAGMTQEQLDNYDVVTGPAWPVEI